MKKPLKGRTPTKSDSDESAKKGSGQPTRATAPSGQGIYGNKKPTNERPK